MMVARVVSLLKFCGFSSFLYWTKYNVMTNILFLFKIFCWRLSGLSVSRHNVGHHCWPPKRQQPTLTTDNVGRPTKLARVSQVVLLSRLIVSNLSRCFRVLVYSFDWNNICFHVGRHAHHEVQQLCYLHRKLVYMYNQHTCMNYAVLFLLLEELEKNNYITSYDVVIDKYDMPTGRRDQNQPKTVVQS